MTYGYVPYVVLKINILHHNSNINAFGQIFYGKRPVFETIASLLHQTFKNLAFHRSSRAIIRRRRNAIDTYHPQRQQGANSKC